MCPLCIATGTLVLASAGSAGGLGAIATWVLHSKRSLDPETQIPKKPMPDRVARSGTVPAKAT